MRIVCPACSAAYEVPDSLLHPGRPTRCARCGREWMPLGETPAAERIAEWQETGPAPFFGQTEAERYEEREQPDEPGTPRVTAMDRLARNPAASPASPIALRIAWGVSVVTVLMLVVAIFVWHSDVAHAWPPSARLFGAFGLNDESTGQHAK